MKPENLPQSPEITQFLQEADFYTAQIGTLKDPNAYTYTERHSEFGERVILDSAKTTKLGELAIPKNSVQYGEKLEIEDSRAPYAVYSGWGPFKKTTFKSGIGEAPVSTDRI